MTTEELRKIINILKRQGYEQLRVSLVQTILDDDYTRRDSWKYPVEPYLEVTGIKDHKEVTVGAHFMTIYQAIDQFLALELKPTERQRAFDPELEEIQ